MKPLDSEQRAMVEAALPLIRREATRLARRWRWVGVDALASAGCEAAVEAASRFDPNRGIPFERFIAKRASGAMRDEIKELTPGIAAAVRRTWSVDERDETEDLSAADLFAKSTTQPLSPLEEQVGHYRQRAVAMLISHLLSPTPNTEDEIAERDLQKRTTETIRRAISERPVEEQRLAEGFFREGWTLDHAALEIGVAKRTVQRMHDRIKEHALKALIRDGLLLR